MPTDYSPLRRDRLRRVRAANTRLMIYIILTGLALFISAKTVHRIIKSAHAPLPSVSVSDLRGAANFQAREGLQDGK